VSAGAQADGVGVDADALPGEVDLVEALLEGEHALLLDEGGLRVVEPDAQRGAGGQGHELDAAQAGVTSAAKSRARISPCVRVCGCS